MAQKMFTIKEAGKVGDLKASEISSKALLEFAVRIVMPNCGVLSKLGDDKTVCRVGQVYAILKRIATETPR